MKKVLPLAVAGVVAATLSFATVGAQAQAPAAGQPAAAGGPGGAPPSSYQGGAPGAPEGAHLPFLMVTSIEVLRSPRGGGMDIIRARGLASSSGWKEPHLLPISNGAPIDGTLDLIFQGISPSRAEPPGPFMPVEAILPVENGHPYKAVRVRAATNAITLKTVPGYVEVAAPKLDCSKCVGKVFVARGAAAPAGVAAGDVVNEADLGVPVRVIRPTDGIPNYVYDPNRLTIVLTEDGRIADAAWD
ncbi:MAG: hypothetical protein KIS73_10605 [Enhydrobacter sp.]|nr:hypothetical protein [Enhydrobacter sp.]